MPDERSLTPRPEPSTLATIRRALEADPRLRSDATKRGYLADLEAFERHRGTLPMSKLLVEEYAARLQARRRSPNSINRALAALRWWARKLADLAQEDPALSEVQRRRVIEQALRVAEVKGVRGSRPTRGRHIENGELRALMQTCEADPTAAGVRDAAIIGLAWSTGLRVSELAGLQLGNVKLIDVEEYDLAIVGKGDKARVVYVYNGAAVALADWLAIRGPGAPSAPLWLPINKSGKVKANGAGPSTRALSKMLDVRTDQAKLSQRVTWHDFRRTFAGNLLDSGADLATVQRLMGHESPTTTSNYDRRGEEVKRKAVRALHVPYTRRAAGRE